MKLSSINIQNPNFENVENENDLGGFQSPGSNEHFFNEFLVVVASLIWALIGDNGPFILFLANFFKFLSKNKPQKPSNLLFLLFFFLEIK